MWSSDCQPAGTQRRFFTRASHELQCTLRVSIIFLPIEDGISRPGQGTELPVWSVQRRYVLADWRRLIGTGARLDGPNFRGSRKIPIPIVDDELRASRQTPPRSTIYRIPPTHCGRRRAGTMAGKGVRSLAEAMRGLSLSQTTCRTANPASLVGSSNFTRSMATEAPMPSITTSAYPEWSPGIAAFRQLLRNATAD